MTNVMLDLETLGTSVAPVILSIGAVKFNDKEITDRFHVGIDIQSCLDRGLRVDGSTILWWFDQWRSEARESWLALDKVDLDSALGGFSAWYGAESIPIWGNGSTFDNVALRSAYVACGQDYPAKFWDDQCYRTMKNRVPSVPIARLGTHHNALNDAESQAWHMIEITKKLGVGASL